MPRKVPTDKVIKYFKAVKAGKNKSEATVIAGYSSPTQSAMIESSEGFKKLERRYKDVILEKISMEEIADEQIKNIVQDLDKGAKNKAIELALARIEPDKQSDSTEEKVMVIMRS